MLSKEQIQKAVDWWTKVIKKPKFDNGDDSFQNEILRGEAEERVMVLTPIHIKKFRFVFEKALNAVSELCGLHCDYRPDEFLSDVMHEAGIPLTNMPWKTNMWFLGGKVIVSYGYGAKQEEI